MDANSVAKLTNVVTSSPTKGTNTSVKGTLGKGEDISKQLKTGKTLEDYEKIFMPRAECYYNIKKIYENNTKQKRAKVNDMMKNKLLQMQGEFKPLFASTVEKLYPNNSSKVKEIKDKWNEKAMKLAGYKGFGIMGGRKRRRTRRKRRKSRRKRRKSRRKRRKSRRKRRR